MKVTVRKVSEGPNEVIIQYSEMTPEVERVIGFLNGRSVTIVGRTDSETVQVKAKDILYVESVDEKTFAYTENEVIRLSESLAALEKMLGDLCFFRCSKSMIMNIDMVMRLKSLPSNRIEATMQGGDKVVISRTYASQFRRRLKEGGSFNEE